MQRIIKPPSANIGYRVNEQITVSEVRVIGASGDQLGIMQTAQAIGKAKEQGLDLVEVSPKAVPPVAKMVNFDKYRYQMNKLAQAQKKNQKTIDVKVVKISVRIGIHDMEVKAKRADTFLQNGDKVKVDMFLKGRERANVPIAFEQFKKFLTLITAKHEQEVPTKKLGNSINALLSPKN